MSTTTLALGGGILLAGFLLRAVAVMEDARRLKRTDPPEPGDGLRGTYLAIRIGAATMAIGAGVLLARLLGDGAPVAAALAAAPLLVLVDLLPRALTGPEPKGGPMARWPRWLGRAAAPFESVGSGGKAAWTHEGLTPLVRSAPPGKDDDERHMARRVYDFGDVTVGDIMVPLVDVIAVRDDAREREAVRVARSEGYSRLPVFRDRLPNVIGILHVFDLLVAGRKRRVREIMKPATFVPEMTPASDVLKRLQVEGINLAVVVDEYGGAVGIVSIEDILEEVVGEIEDEFDEEEDPVRELGPDAWIVDGRAEIERLNERFPWRLPEGEYETIGGLLLARLARIPSEGETLTLRNLLLRVAKASPRSVDEVAVSRMPVSEEEEA